MTAHEREAVLEGIKAAKRLHVRLKTRDMVEGAGLSCIDVFGAADELGAVLLFRRLNGLLGAYLAEPVSPIPGIVVSTERDLHVQRFTAAHELGHLCLDHEPTTDEAIGLWRGGGRDIQELAADAFASEFLLPEWLYLHHARRHRWDTAALLLPTNAYQLSLRLGASYEAVCWGLRSHNILKPSAVAQLRELEPKAIKSALLDGRAQLANSWADVWVVTEADHGLTLEGTPDDVVIFRLPEQAGSGYLWDERQLHAEGFAVLHDTRDEPDGGEYGAAVTRVLTTRVNHPRLYQVAVSERRPWVPSDVHGTVSVAFDMYGKEEGLPRHVRRTMAAA